VNGSGNDELQGSENKNGNDDGNGVSRGSDVECGSGRENEIREVRGSRILILSENEDQKADYCPLSGRHAPLLDLLYCGERDVRFCAMQQGSS